MKISILIAERHHYFGESLRIMLEEHSHDFKVLGLVKTGKEAIEFVHRQQPDILLMDVDMAKGSGLDAAVRILHQYPQIGIIGFSVMPDTEKLEAVKKAGLRGYLSKSTTMRSLARVIRTVHKGGQYFEEA